jgi:hypothetical protein
MYNDHNLLSTCNMIWPIIKPLTNENETHYDCTPSGLVNEVVLDMIWVKHWEYKSWITFKSLSLEMWKIHE